LGFVPPDSHEKALSPTTLFAILAEAPGETETVTLKPLTGSTGEALEREVFAKLGVDRGQVLFDNTLRCRPVNNKYPTGELANSMLKNCRKWDVSLDDYNPTVVIFCYHFTFSLLRAPSARFSAFNAVRKALRLAESGERPLIATGDKAKELLFPALPGPISKWDGKHFYVEWNRGGEVLAPNSSTKFGKAGGLSLAEILRNKKR